ncbi:MAG: hypothetical protein F4Y95_02700 [Chloroflexi bacterium]|nr:hypothetical protein [Chloroflexota bacterium]
MPPEDAEGRHADDACSLDIGGAQRRQGAGPHDPDHAQGEDDPHAQRDRLPVAPRHLRQEQQQDEAREGQQHVEHALRQQIEQPGRVGRGHAQDQGEADPDRHCGQGQRD